MPNDNLALQQPELNAATFTSMQGMGARSSVYALLDEHDSLIRKVQVPRISSLNFEVDGIPMSASNQTESGTGKLVLWATLGYLPYSITSQERRAAIVRILESSHVLPNVKVGITPSMKIIVTASYDIEIPPTPNYIFEPVIAFIQEARPFIRLIADYL